MAELSGAAPAQLWLLGRASTNTGVSASVAVGAGRDSLRLALGRSAATLAILTQ